MKTWWDTKGGGVGGLVGVCYKKLVVMLLIAHHRTTTVCTVRRLSRVAAQFYVQGRAHYNSHSWWHGPLRQLLEFWSLLERRTEVVVNTLEGAAESCFDRGGAPPADGEQQQQQPSMGEGATTVFCFGFCCSGLVFVQDVYENVLI